MAKFKRGHFEAPKPKKDGGGSTVQFDYSVEKHCVYMTVAKQFENTTVSNARFNYEEKLVCKMGPNDISEFVRLFIGKTSAVGGEKGLYHQFERDGAKISTTIKCVKNDKYSGFYLTVLKSGASVAVPITDSEAETLRVLLEQALLNIHGWIYLEKDEEFVKVEKGE